ncbi:MAG: sodium:calcium symporter [Opitutaceae bacterium]
MNPLSAAIETLGLANAWTYLALFLAASLLMLWRLESLLKHGLEGTALGTLVMPYCSGLGNLIFVALVVSRHSPAQEVLTNCLVNNVTNLTLLLGLPALFWGLSLGSSKKSSRPFGKKKTSGAETERQLNRLSLLLTLAAALFFGGVTWALAADRVLDASDGAVLIGLFLFWQCFQIFDVLKQNVRQRRSFGPTFYFDVLLVSAAGYGIYSSLDWLVEWLLRQNGDFINPSHLGWLTGWLMVLPNALLAFFYAARGRADIAYASQVGDGHICIPLCLGLTALFTPITVPAFFETGLAILLGAAFVHVLCVLFANGLRRWMGWPLVAAYAWFVAAGFK